MPDDRHSIEPGDAVLLIVEDDPHYARVLVDLAHDQGLKVLVAMRGADALALAREYQPTAVSLDVFLPDMLGWTVLSQLKQDPATRHIPVQIVTLDEDRQHGLARGAFSFITKPTTTEGLQAALGRSRTTSSRAASGCWSSRTTPPSSCRITELLGHDDIDIVTVGHRRRGARGCCARRRRTASCSTCGCRTCPASRCWSASATTTSLPTCRSSCSPAASCRPRRTRSCTRMARSVVVKGVESPERLLDETALFLHRVVSDLPAEKQRMLERLHSSDEDLVGQKVLLVDDDARNIFALSSVLERRGMQVLTATTGSEAIELLQSTPDVAIVLMDIMMPEMDGYQTMQVIRANPAFRRLPIIALTAKAMKGDREKCLEAGASDYLAKPVNTEQLLSALRMWLHR